MRLETLIMKLRLFSWKGREAWYWDVWRQDPYDQMCCGGYECGCHGCTYYAWWKYLLDGSDYRNGDGYDH